MCRVLREIVNNSDRYRCLSTYHDVESAKSGLVSDSPHIVIFDIGLPDGSGIECIRWLKPRMAKTEFLAFTGQQDAKSIFEAFSAGATGYICKGAEPAEVIQALDDLTAGGSPLSAMVARKMVQAFNGESRATTPLPGCLTRREREILAEIVRGRMLKEIVTTLGISQGTLNTHMTNLYRKLGVNSRNEIMSRYFSANPGSGAPHRGEGGEDLRNGKHRNLLETNGRHRAQ
jgi:DNA-binding NarL/FixJ family response regulator